MSAMASHIAIINCLFGLSSNKTSKLRDTGLFAGNSPVTGEFPAQRASNGENVSIWWRHHIHLLIPIKQCKWKGPLVIQLVSSKLSRFSLTSTRRRPWTHRLLQWLHSAVHKSEANGLIEDHCNTIVRPWKGGRTSLAAGGALPEFLPLKLRVVQWSYPSYPCVLLLVSLARYKWNKYN